MTALDSDFEPAARATQWQGYPLPPAPPRFQVKFNGYKQYMLPAPQTGRPTAFSRATTIAETLDDGYGLNRWKRRETARRVLDLAMSPGEVEFVGPDGNHTARDLLNTIIAAMETGTAGAVDNALDSIDNLLGGRDAAELGECVHAWLEAIDIGTVLRRDVPEMVLPYVDAYQDVLRRYGLVAEPEYVERIVLNDRGEESVAGMIDRVYRVVTTGELVLGDVKTSRSLQYSMLPYAVQLAVYGWATKMLAADGSGWEPMPELSQDFAVLIHVPSDQPERSDAVTMDLWWGGEAMVQSLRARQLRRESKKVVAHKHAIPVPTPDALRYAAARLALTNISDVTELNDIWEQYKDVWDDALTALGEQLAGLLD